MQVPESMKGVWDSIVASGAQKVSPEQYAQLGDAANADTIIDNDENAFLDYVKSQYMGSNSKEGSNPVPFVDTPQNPEGSTNKEAIAFSVNSSDVPPSLKSTWLSLTSDGNLTVEKYEQLLQSIPAEERTNGKITSQMEGFFKVIKKALEENGGNISVVNQGFQSESASGAGTVSSPFGKVPESLKAVWAEVSADGKITAEDLDKLILTGAPDQKAESLDTEEMAFLKKIDEQLIASNGKPIDLNISGNNSGGTVNASSASGKVLLDWPGYTQETKNAVRSAYGNLVKGSKMPILSSQAALQVAQAFGASSVQELQSMIHAKVDGKFGPETFYKAKVFAASAINNSNDPATLGQIGNMLQFLGNDPEVERMKQMISAKSVPQNPNPSGEPVKNNDNTPAKTPPDVNADSPPPIDLGGIDPNNKEAVSTFQKKVNLLIGVYEASTQKNFTKVQEDGVVSKEFTDTLRSFETAINQPAAQAITGVEKTLDAAKLGTLSASNIKYVKFQDNDFAVLADKKDPTRIEAARELLAKIGIDLGSYKIEKPQDPNKSGDVKLVGNGTELTIYDNLQKGRGDEQYGDLHIAGTVNGKKVDLSYWENDRRVKKTNVVVDFFTKDAVEKNGRFRLKATVDGKELPEIKSNEGILKQPLVVIKK